MNTVMQRIALGALVGLSVLMLNQSTVTADDYWDDYWSWYDGSYQPYVIRRYNDGYRQPYYDRYYNDNYGGYYDGYGGGYYYPSYRDYGTRRFGYREYSDGGGAVRVGPLRFGWR